MMNDNAINSSFEMISRQCTVVLIMRVKLPPSYRINVQKSGYSLAAFFGDFDWLL
jgi:hypothetical protein